MKKALVLILAVVMILAFAIPALAADGNNGNGNNKITNEYEEGASIKQDFNNAQFHCNAVGGNGRVWPIDPVDMKKFDGKLTFTKADGTRWDLSKVEDKKGVELGMVVCPECGSTMWITFSNNSGEPDGKNIQMQHPGENITIIKNWDKNNAPYPDGFKFSANFEITLSSGKTFKLGPGKYFLPEDLTATVEEISCSKGFELVKFELNNVEQELGAIKGVKSGDVIKATNEDKKDPDSEEEKGKIELEKLVNGDNITLWATATGNDISKLIDCFNLYKVSGDGASIVGLATIDSKKINTEGFIKFEKLDDGWYAIEEVLTDAGKLVFEEAPLMYILIANSITFTGTTVDFDYDAFYTIINGWGHGYVLGYPGLNNTGDIFYIGVTNTSTGRECASFCANAGSRAFAGESGLGCKGYLVAERMDRDLKYGNGSVSFADFVLAYNYIEENYGDLNENRAITQIVTWTLLGAIDIDSDEFTNIDWTTIEAGEGAIKGVPDAKDKVEKVMANYMNFRGTEKIVDVVYMICEIEDHDYADCQPQLVPIYGESGGFNNTTKKDGGNSLNITVSFNKTKYGGLLPVVADEFAFDLFKIVDDEMILVEANDYIDTNFGSRFYTADGGSVTVNGLKPGDYMFKELRAIVAGTGDALDGYGYKHVWTVRELYFTIDSNGVVTWYDKDGGTVKAVIDNKIVCKGALQFLSFEHIANIAYEAGHTFEDELAWLVGTENFVDYAYDYDDIEIGVYTTYGCQDGGVYKGFIEPATCERNAVLNVSCKCHESHGARIAIPGTALVHNYIEIEVVVAGCVNRGYTRFWCENCGDVYDRHDDDALGHDFLDRESEEFAEIYPYYASYLNDKYEWCTRCCLVYVGE